MNKAELLFAPGCKVGNDNCDGCDSMEIADSNDVMCPFGCVLPRQNVWPLLGDADIWRKIYPQCKRLPECIEAEAKANVMREKIERLEEAIEYHKQVARYAKNKIKRQESKELVAVLMQILEPVK